MNFSFLPLLFTWFTSNGLETAVFTDSQFTASRYGMEMAKQCLNPKIMDDVDYVSITVAPGAGTLHLARKTAVAGRHGYVPIWHNHISLDQPISSYHQTENIFLNDFFEHRLQSPLVKQIIIFMGINNINIKDGKFSLAYWKEILAKIQQAGKKCVIGLPPMVDHLKWNQLIVAHNQALKSMVQGLNCQLIDTSETLKLGIKGKKFKTVKSDNVHFANSESNLLAKTTCASLLDILKRQ